MRIAEIYKSIQGEGLLTGTESVFVRASGCNLRCWFCDTPFTSWAPEGNDLSVGEILSVIEEWDTPHVVVTGGEPMLFAELIPLCNELHRRGRHITIETAGTLYLPVVCDLMSISPKLSNSTPTADEHRRWSHRHEMARHAPDVIHRLAAEYDYQFKFVVESMEHCEEVEAYLLEFAHLDRSRVMLMPQGTDPEQLAKHAAWLEPYCRDTGLVFCPRQQIEWFGPVRGT
ncbi:MAG: 7-carboxy-7-deazaguanine synthase QueE [Pirellulales bacterium]|nr:7-carboxy-7-deazaguanine synthase QueE [Pirellulales bacterium]